MDLNEYKRYVRTLAANRDGQPFYNASMDHASVVIESLFAIANKRIDVLTGSFNPRVYGREAVIEEAKLFLATSRGNHLRVILEKDSAADREFHPLFRACAHFPNLEVRTAPKNVKEQYGFHCVLVDDDSYRFEGDKKTPSAVAAFGDPDSAARLDRAFSMIWDRCIPADVSG